MCEEAYGWCLPWQQTIKQFSSVINRYSIISTRFRSLQSQGSVKALDLWSCVLASHWTGSVQLQDLTSPIPKCAHVPGWNTWSATFLLCPGNKALVILRAAPACGVLSDTFTNIMTSLILDTTITISYESEAWDMLAGQAVYYCAARRKAKIQVKESCP